MSCPRAWVVQCNECCCIVTARTEDPQAHMQDPEPRPTCRLLVTCSCCWTSWLYPPEAMFNGSPSPSPECFKRARQSARTENTKSACPYFDRLTPGGPRSTDEHVRSS